MGAAASDLPWYTQRARSALYLADLAGKSRRQLGSLPLAEVVLVAADAASALYLRR